LPKVVKVHTGFRTVLPGDGTIPAATPAGAPEQALLMGNAERADVIVDFSGLAAGTRVRMINTSADAPFGGFPLIPADPGTTGQVMEFTVTTDTPAGESFTPPQNLVLSLPDAADPANVPNTVGIPRDQALMEEESQLVCVTVRLNGKIVQDLLGKPDPLKELDR